MKAILVALLMFAASSGSASAQSLVDEITQLRSSLEFEAEMARYDGRRSESGKRRRSYASRSSATV
jgi:hypothetical protein